LRRFRVRHFPASAHDRRHPRYDEPNGRISSWFPPDHRHTASAPRKGRTEPTATSHRITANGLRNAASATGGVSGNRLERSADHQPSTPKTLQAVAQRCTTSPTTILPGPAPQNQQCSANTLTRNHRRDRYDNDNRRPIAGMRLWGSLFSMNASRIVCFGQLSGHGR
jgi:hypothetical protein